eukprot:767813-Hanusia_phi.AAC.3
MGPNSSPPAPESKSPTYPGPTVSVSIREYPRVSANFGMLFAFPAAWGWTGGGGGAAAAAAGRGRGSGPRFFADGRRVLGRKSLTRYPSAGRLQCSGGDLEDTQPHMTRKKVVVTYSLSKQFGVARQACDYLEVDEGVMLLAGGGGISTLLDLQEEGRHRGDRKSTHCRLSSATRPTFLPGAVQGEALSFTLRSNRDRFQPVVVYSNDYIFKRL